MSDRTSFTDGAFVAASFCACAPAVRANKANEQSQPARDIMREVYSCDSVQRGGRAASPPRLGTSRWLEFHAQRELHLAWVGINAQRRLTGDHSVGPGRRCWVSRVDNVEAVEGIHPELRENLFTDREILLQREISAEEAWSHEAVPAHIAELIQRRFSVRCRVRFLEERAGVRLRVKARQAGMQSASFAHGITGGTARQRCAAALPKVQCERQPIRPVQYRTELPAADHFVFPAWRAVGPHAAFAERQLVEAV